MSKILLVGKGPPDRGGIPTFLDTLLTGSLRSSHELQLLNVAHAGTRQGGRATAGNLVRTLRDAAAVRRAARGHDIVHIHSALAPTVTLLRAATLTLAARSRGCAVIVHAHGGRIQQWLTGLRRRAVCRIALAPANRVVAVCTGGEQALRRVVRPERLRLIDNGVRTDRALPAARAHRPPRVLYVGPLTPRKGILDLLAAAERLHERGVAHELHILGGTPDEGPASEAVVRAAMTGTARLLDPRPLAEMPAAYADADVFCLPSWWEAMPLSLLEAMSAGLPVVASDVGDVRRAVVDGVTGFVVPAHRPDRLASALEALLDDPGLRRRMGQAGRRRVAERFSADATNRQVSGLYLELQASRG